MKKRTWWTITLVVILGSLAIAARWLIVVMPGDLEVFGGPVPTGTPEPTQTIDEWVATLDVRPLQWGVDDAFTIDRSGTITIAEPFARAMRDAIGRLPTPIE